MQCLPYTRKGGIVIEKEELLTIIPHRGKMLLLDRINVYNIDEKSLEAECDITEGCIFYYPPESGVPAWVGFEYIAQAIAALSGLISRARGEKPKMGYILSVTSMQIGLSFFNKGNTVQIKVKETGRVDLVSTFEGEIFLKGDKVLMGNITVMELTQEKTLIKENGVG